MINKNEVLERIQTELFSIATKLARLVRYSINAPLDETERITSRETSIDQSNNKTPSKVSDGL